MKTVDKQKLFDALCDLVMHEFSYAETVKKVGWRPLVPVLQFINIERGNRGLTPLDFRQKPSLTYGWTEWNSGGGCMIWSYDFADGKSIHTNEEIAVLASIPSSEYWALETDEAQEPARLITYHFPDTCMLHNLSFALCPYLGQEMSDLVAKDVLAIVEGM